MTRKRWQLGVARLTILLAVGSACGTRVDHAGGALDSALPTIATRPADEVVADTPPQSQQTAQSPTGVTTGSAIGGERKENPSAAIPSTAPRALQPQGQQAPSQQATAPRPAGAVAPQPVLGPKDATPPAPTTRSKVVLATVGNYSGPAGASLFPIVQGAQLWVKHINASGGLNGHQVSLLVYDDGSDPARHRVQVQEAIEKEHAIAFLAEAAPFTGKSTVEYITSKRVPVIGSATTEQYFYESPMYFPQASSGAALYASLIASIAQQTVPAGSRKRLGTIVCAEADTCTKMGQAFEQRAESVGFDYVYRARASIAAPDFTSECLAARNAGVEVLFVGLDSNSIRRLATACQRQAYRPEFATAAAIIQDSFKQDPHLDGLVGSANVFPWFQVGTPATDEFQLALSRFGGSKLTAGVGLTTGWTAGKLLEKAAAALPEPPTSGAILRGLWGIKNDTLGGITQPLTFLTEKPATPQVCWFNIKISRSSWVSSDGYKLNCKAVEPS